MSLRASPSVALRLCLPLLLLMGGSAAIAQEAAPNETPETPRSEQDDAATDEPSGDAPPPGMEVRVVTGDPSAAAGDFDAADSVTGFGAADLDALGALSVADLGKYTPNLEIVTTGATTPTFFIRGVGLNDFNPNSAGSVAIYQDDVAINAPAMQLATLYDMEGVNILKGPVGTGPARNASAGAIKLYSRKPTGDFGGYLRSSFGKYMLRDFEGAVEAPLYEDLLSARVAFRAMARDGYVTNTCGGKRDSNLMTSYCGEALESGKPSPIPNGLPEKMNDVDNWAARATLRFLPTLDMEWLLNVHGSSRDELARQGISYGTGALGNGRILGGADAGGDFSKGGYLRPQAVEMRRDLQELLMLPLLVSCQPNCTNREKRLARRQIRDAANTAVARELANNLDGEPYTGAYDRAGKTSQETLGAYVNGSIVLPKNIQLKTVTAYDQYDRELDSDTDQSPNVLFEIGSQDRGWQFFQDIGLEGALPRDWKGSWRVGGHYLMENLDVESQNSFPATIQGLAVGSRDYTQKIWSFGIWQKLDWDFWNDFTLDGGVRYNWERKNLDYLLFRGTQRRTTQVEETRGAPTADVRLTYRFREDIRTYWKYSRGWKGGHFNATSPLKSPSTGDLTPQIDYAEPESNNAFEVGLSGNWLDARLQLNFSLFHYDYSNYQLVTVKNEAGAPPEFIVLNASDVQVYGSEVDLVSRPWDNTRIEARFSWLESSFNDFVRIQSVGQMQLNGVVIPVKTELDRSGNTLLNSPNFKLSLTAEQGIPLGRYGLLTLRYDAAWTDTNFFDATEGRGLPDENGNIFLPENTIGQRPYWIHNLLVRYRPPLGNLEVEGWVRNLTGKVYKTFAFDASQFQNTTIYFVGEPRTWGLTLTLNF